MKREYDFIENLDARDVNYVLEKKKEHAAILVQRNWRKIKAQREYRRNKGLRREDHDYEKTEADLQRIARNEDELKQRRAYVQATKPDNFYRKILDDRKEELQEQVVESRRGKADHEITQLNLTEIFDEFLPRSNRFNDNFLRNE